MSAPKATIQAAISAPVYLHKPSAAHASIQPVTWHGRTAKETRLEQKEETKDATAKPRKAVGAPARSSLETYHEDLGRSLPTSSLFHQLPLDLIFTILNKIVFQNGDQDCEPKLTKHVWNFIDSLQSQKSGEKDAFSALKNLVKKLDKRLLQLLLTERCVSVDLIPPDLRDDLDAIGTAVYGLELETSCLKKNGLEDLGNTFPNLTRLTVTTTRFTDTDVLELLALRKLQILRLKDLKIKDVSLEIILELPELRELSIDNAPNITDDGVIQLVASKQCKKFKTLDFRACSGITGTGWEALRVFQSLRQLGLGGTSITDKSLESMANSFPKLTLLEVDQAPSLTNNAMLSISKLIALRQLDIGSLPLLTDAGLEPLKTLTRLTLLNLANCHQITGRGLTHLAPLTQLDTLDLSGLFRIDDEAVVFISHAFPQLDTLSLYECSLITDKAIGALSKLSKLRNLVLRKCVKISLKGLHPLTKLVKLQKLNILDCPLLEGKETSKFLKTKMNWVKLARKTKEA
jgi:hypothetical protein